MIELFVIGTIMLVVALASITFFLSLDCDLPLYICTKVGAKASKLKGKVIWITGSSSGIGEALVYRLAASGCKLILSGRDEVALNNVKEKCIKLSPSSNREHFLVIPFDVTDYEKHAPALDKVVSQFGRLDILVNNAGRSQRAMFHATDIKVDENIFQVNVFSVVNLSRIVLNYWYKNKIPGHFVVTSSTTGKTGVYNSSSYSGTKHALHGYFNAIRHEGFKNGIKVSLVCPGPVVSKGAERAFTTQSTGTFGAEGAGTAEKKMATDRCASLIVITMANELAESWISLQPVLTFYYLNQYFPTIATWIIPRIMTEERMSKLREGK